MKHSKELGGKLLEISEKELTYAALKSIHDDYRKLVKEYEETPQQADYKG